MVENLILTEINSLSNRKYKLYRQLDHIIIAGGQHFMTEQPQVVEIKQIETQLRNLWYRRRAEGKYWIPRLREGKRGSESYERRLRRGVHGYAT